MNLPSTSLHMERIVSRYATCGFPTDASTLNSRFIRSTRISRCSSPIPEIMVCPDPSFRVKTDEESGQTIISGMGELHLEILVDRMKREFSVEASVGKPQVAYRETIRSICKEVEGKFIKQS